jgi:hypothetical protein
MGNMHVDPATAPKPGGRPRKGAVAPQPKLEAQAQQRQEFLATAAAAPEPVPEPAPASESYEVSDREIQAVLIIGFVGGLALAYLGWRVSGLLAPAAKESVKKAARHT